MHPYLVRRLIPSPILIYTQINAVSELAAAHRYIQINPDPEQGRLEVKDGLSEDIWFYRYGPNGVVEID